MSPISRATVLALGASGASACRESPKRAVYDLDWSGRPGAEQCQNLRLPGYVHGGQCQ